MVDSRGAEYASPFGTGLVERISVDLLEPDENQVRKEFNEDDLKALAESIKRDGQIQPILVTMVNEKDYTHYIIVDGERRWRACKMLVEQHKDDAELVKQFSTINALYVVNDAQLTGILGNIVRNNYNPMETADAYTRLKELLGEGKKITNKVIGERVGKAQNTVSEYLSLLNLPQEIQDSARKDSRVPFNKLKTLAASGMTPDEMITEYNRLFKVHSAKNVGNDDSKDSKLNKDDKRVALIQKKIESVNRALEMKAFKNMIKENMVDETKISLKESLERTIATARNLIVELESQQPTTNAVAPTSTGNED